MHLFKNYITLHKMKYNNVQMTIYVTVKGVTREQVLPIEVEYTNKYNLI